jgi:hypothetical protein
MSIACMTRIWDQSEKKGSELLLLLAIADYADDNGFAWPGIETLAKKTRLSGRHVTRLISQLAETEELVVFNRRAKGNVYIVTTGLTESGLQTALARAKTFGIEIESDNLALYLEHGKSDNLSGKTDIAMSDKTDIAVSPDPLVSVSSPSNKSSEEIEEPDDEWLKHSRIVAPEETTPVPEPVAKSSDPFIRAVQNQQQANWADHADAGGADDYALAPVDAFCDLLRISTTKLPEKKRRDWAKALRGVAHEWGVGPPVLSQCISGIPDSEFHWKTYSTPWQDGFQADLGVLIGQVLNGNGPGDPRIIEVKSR